MAGIAAFALVLPCAFAAPKLAPQAARTEAARGHDPAVAQSLKRLYAASAPERLWSGAGQAEAAFALLRTASAHGLEAAHYDVDALEARHATLAPGDAAQFDQALSQAMLQFLTDLHFGRVKPDFRLTEPEQRWQHFDAAQHLGQAMAQGRVAQAANGAAPTIALYKRVQATLQHYRQLAIEAPPGLAPPMPTCGWTARIRPSRNCKTLLSDDPPMSMSQQRLVMPCAVR